MKTFTLIFVAIISTFFTYGYGFAQTDTNQVEHPPNGHNSPYRIDFTNLISHSQYYDGEQLEVIGYLNLKFESDALWSTEADYSAGDYKKAIPVNLNGVNPKHAKRFNHHYVIMEAVFHRLDRGLGLITLELNVKSLRRWRVKGIDKMKQSLIYSLNELSHTLPLICYATVVGASIWFYELKSA